MILIPFKLSRKIALVTSLSRFKSIEKHNTESKMKKRIFRLRPEVEEGAGLIKSVHYLLTFVSVTQ